MDATNTKQEPTTPFGMRFAEEPKVVTAEMAATTSQWISNPNTKEWDTDQD